MIVLGEIIVLKTSDSTKSNEFMHEEIIINNVKYNNLIFFIKSNFTILIVDANNKEARCDSKIESVHQKVVNPHGHIHSHNDLNSFLSSGPVHHGHRS